MTTEFVLDQEANPHKALLELALDARRRARSSRNLTAQAYYLGILHSLLAATGSPVDEVVGWLDFHDVAPCPAVVPLALLGDEALDVAVRARRLAWAARSEPIVYRYWQGMADLLAPILTAAPELVDAFIAACDPDPGLSIPATQPAVAQRVGMPRRLGGPKDRP